MQGHKGNIVHRHQLRQMSACFQFRDINCRILRLWNNTTLHKVCVHVIGPNCLCDVCMCVCGWGRGGRWCYKATGCVWVGWGVLLDTLALKNNQPLTCLGPSTSRSFRYWPCAWKSSSPGGKTSNRWLPCTHTVRGVIKLCEWKEERRRREKPNMSVKATNQGQC